MAMPLEWQSSLWTIVLVGLIAAGLQWNLWWRDDRAPPILLHWGGFALCAAAAAALMMLGQRFATWVLVLPAPMLALFASALVLSGARAAAGLRPRLLLACLPAILWPVFVVLASMVFDDTEWMCTLCLLHAVLWIIAAVEIWRARATIPFARVLAPMLVLAACLALLAMAAELMNIASYLSLVALGPTLLAPIALVTALSLSAMARAQMPARLALAGEQARQTERMTLAAARMASIGQMAGALAHELRQPLTVIGLALDNLEHALDRSDIAGARERSAVIGAQLERAAWLIEHLRLFARGSGQGQGSTTVILRELVDDSVRLAGEAMRLSGIEVITEFADRQATVTLDASALQQVLVMLMLNARDAFNSSKELPLRRVVLRAAPDTTPGSLTLTVQDTAGGIDPSVMTRIFQPFTSTKSNAGAAGLGLSLCQQMITRMGGQISARNDAAGAVFTLVLPTA